MILILCAFNSIGQLCFASLKLSLSRVWFIAKLISAQIERLLAHSKLLHAFSMLSALCFKPQTKGDRNRANVPAETTTTTRGRVAITITTLEKLNLFDCSTASASYSDLVASFV